MGFQTYQRGTTPKSDKPLVSLQKTGKITMNEAAYEGLGSPDAVELLFDPERRCVALSVAPPGGMNGYPVRKIENTNSYGLTGYGFFRFYGLALPESRRFPAFWEGKLLVVALDGESFPVARGRHFEVA